MITLNLTVYAHESLLRWLEAAKLVYKVTQALHPSETSIKACYRAMDRIRMVHDIHIRPMANPRSPNAILMGPSPLALTRAELMALDEYVTEARRAVSTGARGDYRMVEKALVRIALEAEKCRQSQ